MTEYRVMVKGRLSKRFQCYGHHSDPVCAENGAMFFARQSWAVKVKIIAIDDNGVKNELIYK